MRLRAALARLRGVSDRLPFLAPRPLRVTFPSDADMLRALGLDAAAEGTAQTVARWLAAHADFPVAAERVPDALAWVARERPEWRARWLEEWPPGRDEIAVYERRAPLDAVARQTFACTPGDDILYAMAPHQLDFWPRWLLACSARDGDLSVPEAFMLRWMDGVRSTPDPPAYASNLQAVFRVVALLVGLPFVLAADAERLAIECWRVILADAAFVHERLGESYPNNHHLGDLFLLVLLGTLFPTVSGAAAWRRDGEAEWRRECERQILPDGTSFEHSLHYHELVCQMLVCVRRAAELRGEARPEWLDDRLDRALAFQLAMHGDDRSPLAIGDTTEDTLIPLGRPGAWWTGGFRRCRARWFPETAAPRAAGDDEAGFWFFAGEPPADGAAPEPHALTSFPDGGYFVLADAALGARLVFRTAPAADRALNPGHMHCDLMSVYVSVGGAPLIVEAGTGTYRAATEHACGETPRWREYFMSPAAHNTLVIGDVDPLARGDGDFPGSVRAPHPVASRGLLEACRSGAGLSVVCARNAGSTPYDGHVRGVLHVHGRGWLVWDRIPPGARGLRVELGLQLPPEANVEAVAERHHRAVSAAQALTIAVSSQLGGARVLAGTTDPPGGWYSPAYGRIVAAPQLRFGCRDDAREVAFAAVPGAHPAASLTVAVDPGYLRFTTTLGERRWEAWIATTPGAEVRTAELAFRAEALWLESEDGGTPRALRALGATRLRCPALGIDHRGAATDVVAGGS